MTKFNLENKTMSTPELEKLLKMMKISIVETHSWYSKILTTKCICNIDNGSLDCFRRWNSLVAFDGSTYFHSFGGHPDVFLIEQFSKPIIYHNYLIQYFDSKMYGTYCLYSHYLFLWSETYRFHIEHYFFEV